MKIIFLAMAVMLTVTNSFGLTRLEQPPMFTMAFLPPDVQNRNTPSGTPQYTIKNDLGFVLLQSVITPSVKMGDVIKTQLYIDFHDIFPNEYYKIEYWYTSGEYDYLNEYIPITDKRMNPIRFISNDSITITQELIDNNIVSVCSNFTEAKQTLVHAFVYMTEEDYTNCKAYYYIGAMILWIDNTLPNSINEVKTDVSYKIADNTIYFNDLVSTFALYDLQGKLISKANNVNEFNIPSNINKGIYVMKIDNETTKLIF